MLMEPTRADTGQQAWQDMQGVCEEADAADTALAQAAGASATAVIRLKAESARLMQALTVAGRERQRAEAAAEVAAARSAAASMAMMDMERAKRTNEVVEVERVVEVVREVRV